MWSTATSFTDGSTRGNPGPSAIGIYIRDISGVELRLGNYFADVFTNNGSEFMA